MCLGLHVQQEFGVYILPEYLQGKLVSIDQHLHPVEVMKSQFRCNPRLSF